MAGFDSGVSPPGGMSYAAPLMNFTNFSNWAADDPYQKIFNEQQQKLNAQRLQQGQTALDVAGTFKGGLPIDPQTGQIDYKRAVGMLAQKGDIGALWQGADAMQIQGAGLSPMLANGPQGAGAGAPASVAARPLPPPAANSPQGDAGSGTVASIVTDRLPNQDTTTGQTIAKIAQVMGVDPNSTLSPGQLRRAQGLLQRYAPASASASPSGGGPTFASRFAAATDGGEPSLPPSANAVSPAPKAAPAGGSQPQPQQGAPAQPAAPVAQPQQQQPPQAAPHPQQPQGPITPQVPLPEGYTDPQRAILALRTEAARLSANPRAAGQARELDNWAERIEKSIQPVPVHPGTTLLDPKTGQPVYQGNQPTMSAEAVNDATERYLKTGQFPPNTGRGVQGTADRNAILETANQLAQMRGIDTAELPKKWQEFKSQQVGIQRFTSGPQGNTVRSFNVLVDHLDTLWEAAAALKNGNLQVFNRARQNWAKQTGDSAPTNFDGVKALVGDEIVKAVVGSAGALADREEVKKDLDKASSPKQLSELVDRYRKLALGQLRGLRKQYETATGLKNFGEMLLPGTLSALGGNKGEGSAPDAEGWVSLPNGARIRELKDDRRSEASPPSGAVMSDADPEPVQPGAQYAQASPFQMRPTGNGQVQVINIRTGQVVYTGSASGAANAQASASRRVID